MRNFIVVFFLILIAFVAACTKESLPDPNATSREIAWNSLSTPMRSTVIIDWRTAPVSQSTYQGQNAVAVQFKTSQDALLGPIIVYVDGAKKVVLGYAARD